MVVSADLKKKEIAGADKQSRGVNGREETLRVGSKYTVPLGGGNRRSRKGCRNPGLEQGGRPGE